ncbi:MAG TPA: pantoate--beta-alanine ligase, partial [Mycobacteriales bacterium]|nr:pantoate--beta-alanine ligase [Mycobacteriales bacterium]
MNVVTTRADLAAARAELNGTTAVVMTMGALHEGHRALMRVARERAASTVATIFVNPLQFGPNEDLDRYPRTLDADLAACEAEGVDLVFTPAPDVVYPERPLVTVSAGPLGDVLEGRTRPGHFDGVLTVVAKLLHLTRPDVAVFGRKDAQQLALIRRMVRDLDFPVEVVGVPTVREPDGLALSSRNRYLTDAERDAALAISRALRGAETVAAQGPAAVRDAARATLAAEPRLRLDYAELVDPDTLAPLDRSPAEGLLAVAAWSGSTRLIDNVTISVGATERPTGMYSYGDVTRVP